MGKQADVTLGAKFDAVSNGDCPSTANIGNASIYADPNLNRVFEEESLDDLLHPSSFASSASKCGISPQLDKSLASYVFDQCDNPMH